TPGLALLAQEREAVGVMISASHNPWTDNGVKVFSLGGGKISDEQQSAIEGQLEQLLDEGDVRLDDMAAILNPGYAPGSADRYVAHLVDSLKGRSLAGLKVVVDCGNGAAFEVAPFALRGLGAEVTVLNADPNGRNINDGCGSTDPSALARAVVELHADAGLALDGDADRVVMVDASGELVDGDKMLAVLAFDLDDQGLLAERGVATTVMANLGLRRAFATRGIELVETPVGDRYVKAAMDERGLVLGGEQSGHVIIGALANTGDGTLTGISVLDVMQRTGRSLADLASVVDKAPQVLLNIKVARREELQDAEAFWSTVSAVEQGLGDKGRVLVRASGTEPVVRIMVEALEPGVAAAQAEILRVALLDALGPLAD
ncbi:MAG: phosphoglucosamine mutase, partial [Actinobacteria bacterium]|nr:phosphoglucosamine mutase [Actinomycetota bacterium]